VDEVSPQGITLITDDLMFHSPQSELRKQADALDRRDAAIHRAREALECGRQKPDPQAFIADPPRFSDPPNTNVTVLRAYTYWDAQSKSYKTVCPRAEDCK
jgi:hypothetical protein